MNRNQSACRRRQNGAPGTGRSALLRLTILLAVCTSLPATMASGVEEAALFVVQLRERGYYDTVNDFLAFISTTDLVDEEYKKTIPYEQALTLAAQAGSVGDARQQEAILRESIAKFKKFAEDQPKHPLVNQIRLRVANVYVGLAKARLSRADKPGADVAKIQAEARALFESAHAEAVEAEKVIQAARRKIEPVKPDDDEGIKVRDKLRTDWVTSELLQGAISYEIAKTFPEGSAERVKKLGEAAKYYEAMAEKHRTRLIGLYCRVQQGRCLADKGDYEDALYCFVELLEQDYKDARLRAMQLDALRYTMECWIGQKKYEDAIKMGGHKLRPGEDKTAIGYTLLFLRASAEIELAQTLGGDQQTKKKSLLKTAAKSLKEISKTNNEWQQAALAKLVSLGEVDAEDLASGKEPENFDEAVDKAIAAMQKRGAANAALAEAPPDKKAELEAQVNAENDNAFRYYQMAIAFTDNDSSNAKLRMCHKALCYLYFQKGEFHHATVLGEYLGRHYPQSEDDKFGTWIAFNAWIKEYGQAGEDTDFESQRIKAMAKRIVKRWPGSDYAIEASYQLVNFALQEKDAVAALENLNNIPDDWPRRALGEIKVGQMLWNKYAYGKRLPKDARPSEEVLTGYRDEAKILLSTGLKRAERKGKVDRTLLAGAYALSQLYATMNEPVKAIELFEHEKYGPLTLSEAADPLAIEGDYKLKTYRLALRSYIGALPSFAGAKNANVRRQLLSKAMEMVNKLEDAVGSDEQAESRLTQIYTEMGKELELQIGDLDEKGDAEGKQALSAAFETFLKEIRSREGAATYKSLIWIAQTFFTLAKSNDSGEGVANQRASSYYNEAGKTYKQILSNPKHIKSPRHRTTIERRLAECYRRQGKFTEALDLLVKILRRRIGNVTVQVEAAETLFEAGSEDKDNYVKSILGAYKDEETQKNIVWGWRKMGQMTSNAPAFANQFYKANLYSIRARRELAFSYANKDKEKREKLLAAAKSTILQFHREHPALGGEETKREFDAEMKRLQTAMGEEPVGLPVLEIAEPAEPAEDGAVEGGPLEEAA